ncbi:hypothetical protein ACN28S_37395 [Cystobacter fuscus]
MNLARWLWLPLVLGMAGCEPFDPWYDFPANDNRLQYIGRMDHSKPEAPTYAHPGTTIRFRCDCTGVDVSFEDKGKGGDEHTNFVNILVDGEQAAKVELRPEGGMIRGARALPPGEHVIEIVKRTESYAGNIRFLGVSIQGSLLDPPPGPSGAWSSSATPSPAAMATRCASSPRPTPSRTPATTRRTRTSPRPMAHCWAASTTPM